MGRSSSLCGVPLLDFLDRRRHALTFQSVVTLQFGHPGTGWRFGASDQESNEKENQQGQFPRAFHIRVSIRICSTAAATARIAREEVTILPAFATGNNRTVARGWAVTISSPPDQTLAGISCDRAR
jgi:hypothetical protein